MARHCWLWRMGRRVSFCCCVVVVGWSGPGQEINGTASTPVINFTGLYCTITSKHSPDPQHNRWRSLGKQGLLRCELLSRGKRVHGRKQVSVFYGGAELTLQASTR